MYLTTLGLIFGCSVSSLLLRLFSLLAVSSGCSVVVLWLLVVMAPLVAEHGLWIRAAVVAAPRQMWLLGSTWGLPRSGIRLMSPAWAGSFFTTESPGKSIGGFYLNINGIILFVLLCISTYFEYISRGKRSLSFLFPDISWNSD